MVARLLTARNLYPLGTDIETVISFVPFASGSGKLKDVIYNIYGRDVASNLLELDYWQGGIHITGYLGKPLITRGNRNFETFFVNGRYVKSTMISRAVEDAYKDFMMQHKFPFALDTFCIKFSTLSPNSFMTSY